MKFKDDFREYLKTRFRSTKSGEPLSSKVASDVLSRCHLVEQLTGIELRRETVNSDKAYERLYELVKAKAGDFGASPARPYAYNQHLYSVRLYRKFLSELARETS